MIRTFSFSLAALLFVSAGTAQMLAPSAEERNGGTQSVTFDATLLSALAREMPRRHPYWSYRYLDDSVRASYVEFETRLSPHAAAVNLLSVHCDSVLLSDEYEESARHALGHAFGSTAADYVTELPPVRSAERFVQPVLEWFTDLLDEYDSAQSPSDVTRPLVRQRWRPRSPGTVGTFGYGIRPFNDSPYVFMSYGFSNGSARDLVTAHVRYHGTDVDGEHLEAMLVTPVVRDWMVGAGFVRGGDRLYRKDEEEMQWTLRLDRAFNGTGSVFLYMTRSDAHERAVAGFAHRW